LVGALAGAFLAAVFAFVVAVVPVAAFLAGARLDALVAFFIGALGFPASVFFAGAGAFFVEVVGFAVDAFVVAEVFVLVGAFVAAPLVVDVLALLATVDFAGLAAALVFGTAFVSVFALVAGLFSLVAEASAGLVLGASLTRPEGPLGIANTLLSTPEARALES